MDPQPNVFAIGLHGDGCLPPLAIVHNGIGDEIVHQLSQELGVTRHLGSGTALAVEPHLMLIGQWLQKPNRRLGQLAQVNSLAASGQLIGVGPCQGEQAFGQSFQPIARP